MKRKLTTLLELLISICVLSGGATATDLSDTNENIPAIRKVNLMPLTFTQNQGQWSRKDLFRANAGGAAFWFTSDKVCYQFLRQIVKSPGTSSDALCYLPELMSRFSHENDSVSTFAIGATFVGANPDSKVIGEDLLDYKCNYFIGNVPTQWHTDVPNYKAVVYKDIYTGIDLKYYGNGDGKLEYDFIIQPGADPSQIAIHYDGAKCVCVNDEGQLLVETEWGDVTEEPPLVYQVINGERTKIKAEYYLREKNTFGFRLEGYGKEFAVTIDPLLSYSTYLGGTDAEQGNAIAVYAGGNAYVVGTTASTDFPAQMPFQAVNNGGTDLFITKLSQNGNSLIYSTFLGGNNYDGGNAIAVDSAGNAYVTGYTESSDFPTQNAFQSTYNGGSYDAFVAKLGSAGNVLIYSTYLGGSGDYDFGYAIAVDRSSNAYVAGETESTNFPTQNPFQAAFQGGFVDGFITKLNSAGNGLIYSTYLGGTDNEGCYGIAVDSAGDAFVCGGTGSTDFPTVNPFQATLQGGSSADGFVTKLNASGNSLIYSTYLGGNDNDYCLGITVDGSAYVTGQTHSANFPIQGPFQAMLNGPSDAFITKFNSSGNVLLYSTYLGGNGDDGAYGIAINGAGNAYVTGSTSSTNFPVMIPKQATSHGGNDIFVTKFSSGGNNLIYSTYLGGDTEDDGLSIAIDNIGNAYVSGYTTSTNFPTRNPYQAMIQVTSDAFVTKLTDATCGDANGDAFVNISDVVYLIAYIFSGGPAPNPLISGDANCDSLVNISDAVYLIAYIFSGGPAPCAACK